MNKVEIGSRSLSELGRMILDAEGVRRNHEIIGRRAHESVVNELRQRFKTAEIALNFFQDQAKQFADNPSASNYMVLIAAMVIHQHYIKEHKAAA